MPVRKFRTIEEMNAADRERWLDCADPALADRIAAHWASWSRLVPSNRPRGVRKYRSIEQMNADHDRWKQDRVDRIRDANDRTRKS